MTHFQKQKGFIGLYLTIAVLVIMIGIIASIGFGVLTQQRIIQNMTQSAQAYFAAESGVEDALLRVATNKSFVSPYSLGVGSASANIIISSIVNGVRTITAEGDSQSRFRTAEVEFRISTTGVGFFYGVQVGEGGVTMENNSKIQGAGGIAGNFYSNGPVVGDAGATITGDVTVATGVALSAEFTVCNTDQIVGQSNPQIDFAQSFVAADSKPLSKVNLYLKRVGSPGDRTIRIANDNGGVPATTALASETLNASLVTTNYGWIDIVFSSPADLVAGSTYWIILDAAQNASKYWVWCKDAGGGYAGGNAKYSQSWNSNPWTSVTGDLTFQTYLGTGISSVDNLTVYGNVKANTIINSRICGDAYYQSSLTIDASSKSFLDSPTNPTCGGNPLTPGTGYPNQPDPPVSPMPISDAVIAQWKGDAQAGGTIAGEYNVTSNVSLGPKEITGNLNVNSNNKILTVTGTLYVHGNIAIDNGSTIKCDPAYGTFSCIVITDGWIHIANNGIFSGSGQPSSYIMFLTTLPGCNGSGASCTHHGAAMDLHNNASGAIFYATDSMVYLHNGVNVSEVTAYKLNLQQNAVVTYESGLVNAEFSAGPSAGWTVESWKEIE
ncbi:MAG TPA: pilus assembly PilX N-terminal domain-containing protein [Candidatus Paceibacterota bacterium]